MVSAGGLRRSCIHKCITSVFCGLLLCLHSAQGSLCALLSTPYPQGCFPDLVSRNECVSTCWNNAYPNNTRANRERPCFQKKSHTQALVIRSPAYFGQRQFNFTCPQHCMPACHRPFAVRVTESRTFHAFCFSGGDMAASHLVLRQHERQCPISPGAKQMAQLASKGDDMCLIPRDPHSGRRQLTPASCALTP